ncbi:hypothetical protein ACFE04_016402 [Oxalis oulophora]
MAFALEKYIFPLFLMFSIYPLSLKCDTIFKSKPKVHALYVFGDSLVDSGNNVVLAGGKPMPPYGVDFYQHKPTGRATNGKTVADYFALYLGLPLTPAYLTLSELKKRKSMTGINYASGGSGILPTSNDCNNVKTKNPCLPLDTQIDLYQHFVQNNLVKMFKNLTDFKKYQSRALFFVSTGVNDLSNNLTKTIPPGTFDDYLLDQLAIRLKRLYGLGARKFLVNNMPPKGCFPVSQIGKYKSYCPKSMDEKVHYNILLPNMLKKLQSILPGSKFSQSDIFKFLVEFRINARKYGVTDVLHPCCPEKQHYNGTEKCLPNSTYCKNRNTHMFFDMYHPSQIANNLYAEKCFNESSICTPLNLRQLAQA